MPFALRANASIRLRPARSERREQIGLKSRRFELPPKNFYLPDLGVSTGRFHCSMLRFTAYAEIMVAIGGLVTYTGQMLVDYVYINHRQTMA